MECANGRKFKSGDVVKLRSWGPRMTVVEFGEFGMGTKPGYQCRWFDDKHKLVEDVFTEPESEANPD